MAFVALEKRNTVAGNPTGVKVGVQYSKKANVYKISVSFTREIIEEFFPDKKVKFLLGADDSLGLLRAVPGADGFDLKKSSRGHGHFVRLEIPRLTTKASSAAEPCDWKRTGDGGIEIEMPDWSCEREV